MISTFYILSLFLIGSEINTSTKTLNQPVIVKLDNIIVDTYKPIGKIISSYKPDRFLADRDLVYLQIPETPISVGDRFFITKNLGSTASPGEAFEEKGNHIVIKGVVHITQIKNGVVVGQISETTEEVFLQDEILPIFPIEISVNPLPPSTDIRGRILSSAKSVNMMGAFEFAFINRGSNDGLKVGDRLFIYRTTDNQLKIDPKLPEVPVAELMVAHLDGTVATVYCISARESFEAGSYFKSAISDVKYLDNTGVKLQ